MLPLQGWHSAQRDSAPTASLICGRSYSREGGDDFSLVSASKEELGRLKLAKTNQNLDKGERSRTPAILTKWPEQGLGRPLHSAHTSSAVPAPTHQPFSTLGKKVSRATRSPAAGPDHLRLPGTGSPREGQTDRQTQPWGWGTRAGSCACSQGTLIRREMFVTL